MNQFEEEFNQYLQFTDVTSLFKEACQGLELGEMINHQSFNLHDSMSYSELCDPKMDLKVGYKEILHPHILIANKTIKPAEVLSPLEILALLDQILAYEFLWLKGYSLSQTLYKCIYFFDEQSYAKNAIVKSYLEGIYLGGTIIIDTLRCSTYLREDDYIATVFGFPKTENEQSLIGALNAAEEQIKDNLTNPNTRKKKNLKMNEYDGIDARLKFRKAFLKLVVLMNSMTFSSTIEEQIQIQINSCKKRLAEIKLTQELYTGKVSNMSTDYFQKNITKTLNCLIAPRPCMEATVQEGVEMVDNFLHQMEYILSLSKLRDFNQIIESIKTYNSLPKNTLAKAFLDINIFSTSGKFFSSFGLEDMVKSIFKDYGLKEAHFQTSEFQEYCIQCCIVIQEYIAKYLLNPYRQYRDFSKMYQDFSILISYSDKYEKQYLTKKDEQQLATSWCYSLACRMMTNQLHLGFQMNLFDQADFSQIFFALELLYNILEINAQTYLLKVDKQMIQAFYQKENIDANKKKLKSFQKSVFHEFLFYKGMQVFSKASARLCYLMEQLKLVNEFNDEKTKRNRYINRFKLFQNVFYLRFSTYEQFVQKISEICPDITKTDLLIAALTQIKEMFTQAQQLFQKIPGDDDSVPPRIVEESKKLVRVIF